MGDFWAATDTISPLTAVLWVFYPMAALVLVELILRTFNDDDDDDDGKGIRIRSQEMVPAYAPSPTWLIGLTITGGLLNDGMVV